MNKVCNLEIADERIIHNTFKKSISCFFLMKWKYKTSGKIKITEDRHHIQSRYLYGSYSHLAMLIAIDVQINVPTKMFHNFITITSLCCFLMYAKII